MDHFRVCATSFDAQEVKEEKEAEHLLNDAKMLSAKTETDLTNQTELNRADVKIYEVKLSYSQIIITFFTKSICRFRQIQMNKWDSMIWMEMMMTR
jgi:hypothetical protein